MKFLLEVDRGPWTTPLNFYDDPDTDLDSGSGFSETTGWIFMKLLLEIDRGPWTIALNFYDDPDPDPDSRKLLDGSL